MNKKIVSILSLVSIPLSVLAIDIGVLDSGINWGESKLTMTEFVSPETPAIADFNCFGITAIDDFVPLSNLFISSSDGSDRGTELEDSMCETVGDYTFKIELVDEAGNSTEKTDYKLKVFPSDADTMALSYIDCDSTSTGIIADGNEECELSIDVFDQYNNKFADFNDGIGQRNKESFVELTIPDQIPRVNFDYFDDSVFIEDLFRDGIVLPSSKKLDSSGQAKLSIKAKAPSIDVIEGNHKNAQVSLLTAKPAALGFEFDSVEDDGTLNTSSKNILSAAGNFKFYPWVKSDIIDPDGGTSDLEVDGAGEEINVIANTGMVGVTLPSNLTTKLMGVPPVAIDIVLGDDGTFTLEENLKDGVDIFSWSTVLEKDLKSRFLKLIKAIGISEVLDWGLTTRITHNLLGGGTITYPGGNLGDYAFRDSTGNYVSGYEPATLLNPDCLHCDGTGVGGSITFIGADIEGQIQSNQSIFALGQKSGDGHIISMGGVSAKDSREKIVQNAYALYRGLEPLDNMTESDLSSGIDFTAELSFNELKYKTKVAYFRGGTVTLGGTITGTGTIIVVDGNIVIEDDMEYANAATDSLGIILVNSKVGKPDNDNKVLQTGNVFVYSNIQKIIGTYFAEGSLLSTTDPVIETPYVDDYNYPSGLILADQLLLKGTIFSYNTLGGSEVLNDNNEYSTPWGDAADRDEAVKYDIHHIRRYDGGGSCVTGTNNDAGCDMNSFAFIIRPDGKVKNQTPPGFKDASVSYR